MGWFRETAAGAVARVCVAMLLVVAAAGPSIAFGAEPEASEEITCVGDSCQPLPSEPEDPMPGTLVPNPGNPPLRFSEPKKLRHRAKRGKHHRGGKHKHGKHDHAGRATR